MVAPHSLRKLLLREASAGAKISNRHWLHPMTIGRSQCFVKGSSQYDTGPTSWNRDPMAKSRPPKRNELRLSESWRRRVGVALRAARAKAKLTQPKLAEKAGLDWTTISQIENGASAPDLATMEAIADALGVTLDVAAGRPTAGASGFWTDWPTAEAGSTQPATSVEKEPLAGRVATLEAGLDAVRASLARLKRSRAVAIEEKSATVATEPQPGEKRPRRRRRKKAG